MVIHRHTTPRLHNYKNNWNRYREEITNNIKLQIRLKNPKSLELAIETLIKVMQQAAIQSTPLLNPQKCIYNIPLKSNNF
jgi:t-SNARE complex subunit (syntaxin)